MELILAGEVTLLYLILHAHYHLMAFWDNSPEDDESVPSRCLSCGGSKGNHMMVDFGGPYSTKMAICMSCFGGTVRGMAEAVEKGAFT